MAKCMNLKLRVTSSISIDILLIRWQLFNNLCDSNGHFQKIMSISFNSHLKRQQIRSIYYIKTIFVLDSIDFNSYVLTCRYIFLEDFLLPVTTVIGWEKYWQPNTVSVGILVVLSCDFINVHGKMHESKISCHLFYFYTTDTVYWDDNCSIISVGLTIALEPGLCVLFYGLV